MVEELEKRLIETFQKYFEVDDKVNLDTSLTSLTLRESYEFGFQIEKDFGISISSEKMLKFRSLKDYSNYLRYVKQHS